MPRILTLPRTDSPALPPQGCWPWDDFASLPPPLWRERADADPAEFLACYARIVSRDAADWETAAALLADGFSKESFEQKCTKTNAAIKRALGLNAAPYLIAGQGKRPQTRYALNLPGDCLEIY